MSVHYDITADYLKRSNYRVLHAGDDYNHTFTALRAGSPIDNMSKIWFTVKNNEHDLDSEAKLQYSTDDISEIEITDSPNGVFVVHLKHGDTDDMAGGHWVYDIQTLLTTGDVITLARGIIQFLANLTRVYS